MVVGISTKTVSSFSLIVAILCSHLYFFFFLNTIELWRYVCKFCNWQSQMTFTYLFGKHLDHNSQHILLALLHAYALALILFLTLPLFHSLTLHPFSVYVCMYDKKEILRFIFGSSLIILWGNASIIPRMILWLVASF